MRFRVKQRDFPRMGQLRIKTGYLWFPVVISGEFRWLETATIEQKYRWDGYDTSPYWEHIRFIDPEE